MKLASSLPVGKTGRGELSFNETQSRVALFNFRQLCHPSLTTLNSDTPTGKRPKYFPQISSPKPSNTVPSGRRKVIWHGCNEQSQDGILDSYSTRPPCHDFLKAVTDWQWATGMVVVSLWWGQFLQHSALQLTESSCSSWSLKTRSGSARFFTAKHHALL